MRWSVHIAERLPMPRQRSPGRAGSPSIPVLLRRSETTTLPAARASSLSTARRGAVVAHRCATASGSAEFRARSCSVRSDAVRICFRESRRRQHIGCERVSTRARRLTAESEATRGRKRRRRLRGDVWAMAHTLSPCTCRGFTCGVCRVAGLATICGIFLVSAIDTTFQWSGSQHVQGVVPDGLDDRRRRSAGVDGLGQPSHEGEAIAQGSQIDMRPLPG
jgi:hypothetical protein